MFHNFLPSLFYVQNSQGHMSHANHIGRFHSAENNYYYRRWKICLKYNEMHLFLPKALGEHSKFSITKGFKKRMKRTYYRCGRLFIHIEKLE